MSDQTAHHTAPARGTIGAHARNISQPRPGIEAALILAIAVALQATAPWDVARAGSDRELRLQAMVNETRMAAGLPGLGFSEPLSAVARAHSATLAGQRRLFHHDCLTCVVGVSTWRVMGENVGAGTPLRAVHRAFMRSASHRANILNADYGRVGIGVVRGGRRLWVTEIFVG
jgi:uncharacterized protein YkwD